MLQLQRDTLFYHKLGLDAGKKRAIFRKTLQGHIYAMLLKPIHRARISPRYGPLPAILAGRGDGPVYFLDGRHIRRDFGLFNSIQRFHADTGPPGQFRLG
jgi:hypothetical protein